MKRANATITIILAVLAIAAWIVAIKPYILGLYPDYPSAMTALAVTLSAAACFGWLLLWLSHERPDNETRCRQCGYILRGITEPRCPECGQRI